MDILISNATIYNGIGISIPKNGNNINDIKKQLNLISEIRHIQYKYYLINIL